MRTKLSIGDYLAILAIFLALAIPEALDNQLNPLLIMVNSYPIAAQDIIIIALLIFASFRVFLRGTVWINQESRVVWFLFLIIAVQAIHGLKIYNTRDVIKDARMALYLLALPAIQQLIPGFHKRNRREQWMWLAIKTLWIAPIVGTIFILLSGLVAPTSVSTSWRIQWRTFDIAIPSLSISIAWAIKLKHDVYTFFIFIVTVVIVCVAVFISGSRGLITTLFITITMTILIELTGSFRLGKKAGMIKFVPRRLNKSLYILFIIGLSGMSGWYLLGRSTQLSQSLSGSILRLSAWKQSGLLLDEFRNQLWSDVLRLLKASPELVILGSGLGQTYRYELNGQVLYGQLPAESTLLGFIIKTGILGIVAFITLLFLQLRALIQLLRTTLKIGILTIEEEAFVVGITAWFPTLLLSLVLEPGMWVYRTLPLYFVMTVLVTTELSWRVKEVLRVGKGSGG